MRKLDRLEKATIQIALEIERDKIRKFIDLTPEGFSKSGYQIRLKRVEDLIDLFSAADTVAIGT